MAGNTKNIGLMMAAMAAVKASLGMNAPTMNRIPDKRIYHGYSNKGSKNYQARSKYIPAGPRCNVDHKPKHLRTQNY